MGEIKQTNFRLNEETVKAFRQFCDEKGLNQAQGFDHIMQIVELDRAKAVTPDRLTEIEDFERSVKSIMAAYLKSIEINNNAEARIREQFASSLDRKDKTIDDLRFRLDQLRLEKEKSEAALIESQKAQAAAEEREKNATEQMQTAQKMAADKEKYNNMIGLQLAEANTKLNGYDDLKESKNALESEVSNLKRVIEDLKKEAEHSARSIQAQAELEKERAVMEKEREMHEQLRHADKENAKLEAKIEQLQTEIMHLTRGKE